MRTCIISAAVALAALLGVNGSARADHGSPYFRLVDGWYHRYLGRHADPLGARDHIFALKHGTPADVVEASILGSPEYYLRHGASAEGFVIGMFSEVVGRYPTRLELDVWVRRTLRSGDRTGVALDLLREFRDTPVVIAPTVIERPVIVERGPIFTPAPVIVTPPPVRVAPVYVHPVRPAFSIDLRFGR